MYPYNLDEQDVFNINCLDFRSEFNKDDNNSENAESNDSYEEYASLDEYILELIREAISDEYRDANYYEELSKMANTPEAQRVLRKIHLDELKHFKIFQEIYYQLTGEKAEVNYEKSEIEGSLAENYSKSIFNELEAVEFYRIILFSFLNIPIRDWLYEIITDEQAHAQKLNYLYTNEIVTQKN